MEHAPIGPSSMARISKCPASVPYERNIPQDDTPHETRDIGTAVHWVNEMTLILKPVSPGSICPDNGIIITQEMINRGKLYVDLCKNVRGDHHIEERVECKRIHETDCWGTPDFWAYDPNGNYLTLIDYKDGYIDVQPTDNPQLITYASGIVDQICDTYNDLSLENTMTVRCIIVQPRSGGIKTWSTMAVALRPFINQYHNTVTEALSDEPRATAGEHCKYCRAKATCKSLGDTIQNMIAVVISDQIAPDLVQELEFIYFAEALIKARKASIEALCFKNPPVGYQLTTGRGRKLWKDEAEAKDIAKLYGVDIEKAPALITPIQAISAGIPKELIDNLSVVKPGKPCLKKTDLNILNTPVVLPEGAKLC